ncbi:copper resistance CopC family protein [Actinoplanes auranticolor]|nr:copper resistance CopC family protein [Actinoplanes auranticolor]
MHDTDLLPDAHRRGLFRRIGLATALTVVLMALVPPGAAWAHNALTEATPAKNATLEKAPAGVELRFLQKLDPDDTTITVTGADRKAVATSPPAVDGATGSVTFTEPLTNGEYTVAYRVASRDGHKVQGSYRFTVADPASTASAAPPVTTSPSAAPVAAGTPATQPAAETTSTTSGPMVIAGLGTAGVLLVAGGYWFARRRRTHSS